MEAMAQNKFTGHFCYKFLLVLVGIAAKKKRRCKNKKTLIDIYFVLFIYFNMR